MTNRNEIVVDFYQLRKKILVAAGNNLFDKKHGYLDIPRWHGGVALGKSFLGKEFHKTLCKKKKRLLFSL